MLSCYIRTAYSVLRKPSCEKNGPKCVGCLGHLLIDF